MTGFSISYAKGIKLRLQRENIRYSYKYKLIQLSTSNLFLKLFHLVDVVSTLCSVLLIHMEIHLRKSVKMLSLTSVGQLVSQDH